MSIFYDKISPFVRHLIILDNATRHHSVMNCISNNNPIESMTTLEKFGYCTNRRGKIKSKRQQQPQSQSQHQQRKCERSPKASIRPQSSYATKTRTIARIKTTDAQRLQISPIYPFDTSKSLMIVA